MLKRDGYMHGVPCWVDTNQPDPEAAVAFYGGLFGWEFEDAMPADADERYYIARLDGGDVAAVGSQADGAPGPSWNTYIWVDSVDDAVSKVLAAGGLVMSKPFDVSDAGRLAVCTDPEGAAFCLWEARRHRGAQTVNLPGSLNFNGLNTRDPERAKAFYGSVLGGARSTWARPAVPGASRATASSSSRATRAYASGWPTAALLTGSQTSSPRSARSPRTRMGSRRPGA